MEKIEYENYKKKPISLTKAILKSIAMLLLALVIFVVGIMFYCNIFLSYYPISGPSMRPLINATYYSGDCAYATPNIKSVTYGDIIIYNRPPMNGESATYVIKRVIAMGNDNIMIKEDNGEYAIYLQYNSTGEWKKLEEDYIKDKSSYKGSYEKLYDSSKNTSKIFTDENGNKYYHIDKDEIFYAGDNRPVSIDCFSYGAMKTERLVAKVVYLIHKGEPRIWQVVMQFLGIYKWR